MYFETIHNIDQFDEVEEDDGCSSYLEADTDMDDQALGSLLFAHVNGDSASVLCLEQISDVLAMREREKQGGRPASLGIKRDDGDDARRTVEYMSHPHTGSDRMHDRPGEAFAPEDSNPAEHIYETLDDCGEQYVLYIAKGSDGSSGDTPAKPSSDVSERSDGSGKPKLPKQNSLPGSQEQSDEVQGYERRKSEGDLLRKKKRCCTEKADNGVAPKLPNRPSRVSNTSADSAEYAAIPAASVERRHSCKKGAVAQATAATEQPTAPQSLVIKHKGKTYLIPVVETKEAKAEKSGKHQQQSKKQSRSNPNSLPRQTVVSVAVPPQMMVAGVTLRPMSRSESAAFNTCAYQSSTALPISIKTDHTSPHRRKVHKQHTVSSISQHTNIQTAQVTHYGVL